MLKVDRPKSSRLERCHERDAPDCLACLPVALIGAGALYYLTSATCGVSYLIGRQHEKEACKGAPHLKVLVLMSRFISSVRQRLISTWA